MFIDKGTQWSITQPLKRNEIGSFVEMWMNLEPVIQGEGSQKEKNKGIVTHMTSRKTVLVNPLAGQE